MTAVIRAFIASQTLALEQLAAFAETSAYERLLAALRQLVDGEHEAWLAGWLVERDETLGTRPLDLARQPGGVEVLIARLEGMAGGLCA